MPTEMRFYIAKPNVCMPQVYLHRRTLLDVSSSAYLVYSGRLMRKSTPGHYDPKDAAIKFLTSWGCSNELLYGMLW